MTFNTWWKSYRTLKDYLRSLYIKATYTGGTGIDIDTEGEITLAASEQSKLDALDVSGGTTGQTLVQQPGGGFAPQTIVTGSNNVINNYNTQKIDTSLVVGNYGTLSGVTDGANTAFTVSNNVYVSGTLEVFLNGKQVFDFSETVPASGTFSLTDAPLASDWLLVKYLTAETSSSTLFDPSRVYFQTMQQLKDAYAIHGGSAVYSPIGMINAGTVELEVSDENLVIVGNSYFVSGIFSTEDNYTMFKNETGQFASNIDIRQCSFWASGVSSKLFDLDGTGNNGAIEFNSCNIGDFDGQTTEIGTLTGFRQFKTVNCGFFRTQDSLKFAGTWTGGFRITESIVLAQGANSTLFEPVAGLTFAGRCISDINAASVDPTTVTFDFVESNFLLDGGFQLTGASFAPNSSISVTTDETSIKAYFRDCVEIKNTHVRALIESTTAVINTLEVDVPEKVEGATAIIYNTWMSSVVDNRITIDTNQNIDVEVSYRCRVDAGPNDELAISIVHWDDSTSTFTTVAYELRTVSNLVGGLDVVDFNIDGVVASVTNGDYFEPRIENTTDGTDATVSVGAKLKIVRI